MIAVAIWSLGQALAPAMDPPPEPPPAGTLRYDEDYAYLATARSSTMAWWEPFKYVPLFSEDPPPSYLSFGLELWLRTESYEALDWDRETNDTFLWGRVLPYIDVHIEGVRGFAQLIAAGAIGIEAPGPVDQNSLDLLQGFVEIDAFADSPTDLVLRFGRQLLRLGSGRLVDIRYGVNVLEPFDGIRFMLDLGRFQMDGLWVRPVNLGTGVFDDEAFVDEALWSVYATVYFDEERSRGADLYYLGYRNPGASFQNGEGLEVRHTMGLRGFGSFGPLHLNYELFLQLGTLGRDVPNQRQQSIVAWSVATDTHLRIDWPTSPVVGVKFNVVSGDTRPDDDTLETFNPLFPRGKYFGELTPIGPANLVNVHPNLTLQLDEGLSVGSNIVLYWRYHPGDALYGLGGGVLREGIGASSRYVGLQWDLFIEHQMGRSFDYVASYSQFHAGDFVRETGPDDTIRFVAVEARFHF